MTSTKTGFMRASVAWGIYKQRLPWRSRAGFYAALNLGIVSTLKNGGALYVTARDMEALAAGDMEALRRGHESMPAT